MKYPEKFKSLLEHNYGYIGCGNPNAKILVIGKEPAIKKESKDKTKLSKQYTNEITYNREQWINNCKAQLGYDDQLPNSFLNWNLNNPLFPYKGQKCKVRTTHKTDKDTPFVHGEGGTSRTWAAYQKLYDLIAGNPPKGPEDEIDFHKYIFSSDLSSETAPMSTDTNPLETQASVHLRNEMFKLFPDFPIIIVAAGHYPRYYKFDMQETFHVKWNGETIHVGQKFINIHYNEPHTKLLIHTNQLSYYTYDLLNRIAQIVRLFITEDLKETDIQKFLMG